MGPDDTTLDELVLREFGAGQYETVMRWPYRLIVRGVQIERQREAGRKLAALRLQALADGMEQGKEYVLGKDDPKPKSTDGHYSLKRFRDAEDALERQAEPWVAEERQRQRRVAEQEEKWRRAKAAIRGISA